MVCSLQSRLVVSPASFTSFRLPPWNSPFSYHPVRRPRRRLPRLRRWLPGLPSWRLPGRRPPCTTTAAGTLANGGRARSGPPCRSVTWRIAGGTARRRRRRRRRRPKRWSSRRGACRWWPSKGWDGIGGVPDRDMMFKKKETRLRHGQIWRLWRTGAEQYKD